MYGSALVEYKELTCNTVFAGLGGESIEEQANSQALFFKLLVYISFTSQAPMTFALP